MSNSTSNVSVSRHVAPRPLGIQITATYRKAAHETAICFRFSLYFCVYFSASDFFFFLADIDFGRSLGLAKRAVATKLL